MELVTSRAVAVVPFVLSALLSLVLTACGGGSGSPPSAAAAADTGASGAATPIAAPNAPGVATPNTLPVAAPGTTAGASTPSAAQGSATDTRANAIPVVVKSSPRINDFNRPFVSVTICVPGTTVCQVIDNVLVDTGSTGFRVLASALGPPLKLPQISDNHGRQVAACALFGSVSSTAKPATAVWGSVRQADLKIADMVAPSLSIQLVNDPSAAPIPDTCRNAADKVTIDFGFNGILGIRGFEADCAGCATAIPTIPRYYSCAEDTCAAATLPVAVQVKNPVALFGPGYDNGFALTLPAVNGASNPALQGSLVFGIGSRANNQLENAKIFRTDRSGLITTVYGGTQVQALLDTGAPFVTFYDPDIPRCAAPLPTYLYCPAAAQLITAINQSTDGMRDTFGVTITRPTLTPTLVGAFGSFADAGSRITWGLPFYFGRTVYAAIDGRSTPAGVGPYIAY